MRPVSGGGHVPRSIIVPEEKKCNCVLQDTMRQCARNARYEVD